MFKLIATIALILSSVFAGLAPAQATAPIDLTGIEACIHGDGSGQNDAYYWDGGSNPEESMTYIMEEDDSMTIVSVPAEVAPIVPMDEHATYAWDLFDAVGAADLLPAEGGHVDLIGFNQTGFPNLAADMITVWDNYGNHYLFQVS